MGMTDKTRSGTDLPLGKSVQQIGRMAPVEAAGTVEGIADRFGDRAALDVLDQLSPVVVAAMLRRHDFSCPAVVSYLVTPHMAAEVLKADPLFWRDIPDPKRPENFRKIRENALELIIIFMSAAKDINAEGDIIDHIFRDDRSRNYLLLPFSGQEGYRLSTGLFDDPETETGSVAHLYEILRKAAPRAADLVMDFMNQNQTSLIDFVTDLWADASLGLDSGSRDPDLEDMMFLPIRVKEPA